MVGDRVGKRFGEGARLALGAPLHAHRLLLGLLHRVHVSITRVIVSAVLLPEVRTVGFAIGRVADSILWLSVGGCGFGLLSYFGYYLFFGRDAARMQATLAKRVG